MYTYTYTNKKHAHTHIHTYTCALSATFVVMSARTATAASHDESSTRCSQIPHVSEL